MFPRISGEASLPAHLGVAFDCRLYPCPLFLSPPPPPPIYPTSNLQLYHFPHLFQPPLSYGEFLRIIYTPSVIGARSPRNREVASFSPVAHGLLRFLESVARSLLRPPCAVGCSQGVRSRPVTDGGVAAKAVSPSSHVHPACSSSPFPPT